MRIHGDSCELGELLPLDIQLNNLSGVPPVEVLESFGEYFEMECRWLASPSQASISGAAWQTPCLSDLRAVRAET